MIHIRENILLHLQVVVSCVGRSSMIMKRQSSCFSLLCSDMGEVQRHPSNHKCLTTIKLSFAHSSRITLRGGRRSMTEYFHPCIILSRPQNWHCYAGVVSRQGWIQHQVVVLPCLVERILPVMRLRSPRPVIKQRQYKVKRMTY